MTVTLGALGARALDFTAISGRFALAIAIAAVSSASACDSGSGASEGTADEGPAADAVATDGGADVPGGGDGADLGAETVDEPDGLVDGTAEPGDATPDGADAELPQAEAGDAGDPEASDGSAQFDTFLTDCEEMGIAENWLGTWLGAIDYDIQSNGLVYPEQGVLEVGGDLSFSIQCIDSKLVVSGDMDGLADVPNFEPVPFTLALQGYYDPTNQKLTAEMVDGVVSVLGIVEIYFEGTFGGDMQEDGTLAGTWQGKASDPPTNTPLVTGTAEGEGTWTAWETAGGAGQ